VVIEHEAGDLTCTVEAATPMTELQATLAGAGQMLALDPPGDERLTVGDVFDLGLFGPRAHRYGRPRDQTCPSCSPGRKAGWAGCWS
jgi:glycolate oxidase FAD binding subunit